MSERTDLACDGCSAPINKRCHPDCRNYEEDDLQETAEEVALGTRIAYLESELERIRPVYEAACAWRELGQWTGRWFQETDQQEPNDALAAAVDRARGESPDPAEAKS